MITCVDTPSLARVMTFQRLISRRYAGRFKESEHKNTDFEVLKATIRAQLKKLICQNQTRVDFAERFKQLSHTTTAAGTSKNCSTSW
jgi:hypothetical protein